MKALALSAILLIVSPAMADVSAAVGLMDAADAKLAKVQEQLMRADALTVDLAKQLNQKDTDHAKAVNDLNERWKGEYDKVSEKLKASEDTQNRLFGFIGTAVGGAVFLLGALLLAFKQPEGGVKLIAVGILIASVSHAFVRWGPVFALVGVVLAIGILIYEIVATRNAARELADGQKQIENAKLIPDAVRSVYDAIKDQATDTRAKRVMKQVTS